MVRSVVNRVHGRRRIGFVLLALLSLAVIAYVLSSRENAEVPLKLGEKQYSVRVVSNESDRIKGLSGTASLAKDQGLLFNFGEDGEWGIWMKDMNYPIDILWIDSSKTIVHFVENAQPSSYPDTTFRPKVPARYVLELAAGSVSDASVAVGDSISFDLEKYKEQTL